MKSYIVFFRKVGSRDTMTAYCNTELASDIIEAALKDHPEIAGALAQELDLTTEIEHNKLGIFVDALMDKFTQHKQ